MPDERGLALYAKAKPKKRAKMRTLVCVMCKQSFELELKRGPARQYCDKCRVKRSRELHRSAFRRNRISFMKSEIKPLIVETVREVLAEAGLLPQLPHRSNAPAEAPAIRTPAHPRRALAAAGRV